MIKILFLLVYFATLSFSEIIADVTKVPGNVFGISPLSKAWMSADFIKIRLNPYFLVPTNDKELNELNTNLKSEDLFVKILSDGVHIAFLLKWRDSSINLQRKSSLDQFFDAFSISFVKDNSSFPYVHDGYKDREIIEYYKRADMKIFLLNNIFLEFSMRKDRLYSEDLDDYDFFEKNKERDKEIFSLFEKPSLKKISSNSSMEMVYKNGYWLATLTKNLDDKSLVLNKKFFPLYISVWDGERRERGDVKRVTPWFFIKMRKESTLNEIKDLLKKAQGDIDNGAKLVDSNCAVCHIYKDKRDVSPFMAPNLSHVGGYASYAYILESLLKPNNVIKMEYLKKSHPNYPWYNIEDGEKISTMPSFDWMSEKEIEDIISYLQTLK